MSNNTSTNPTGGQEPNVGPSGQEPNSKGQEPNETPKPALSREALESIVAELRNENAENRIKLKKLEDEQKKREKAAKDQEEQQLREQNQFKELAEKYGAKVQELEPTVERYTALSTLLADQIKAQIKDWPKEVKDLLPSDDTPIESRYAQVQKLQAFVDKLNASTAPQTRPGNAPNPKPASPTPEGLQQRLENQLRASGKYRA